MRVRFHASAAGCFHHISLPRAHRFVRAMPKRARYGAMLATVIRCHRFRLRSSVFPSLVTTHHSRSVRHHQFRCALPLFRQHRLSCRMLTTMQRCPLSPFTNNCHFRISLQRHRFPSIVHLPQPQPSSHHALTSRAMCAPRAASAAAPPCSPSAFPPFSGTVSRQIATIICSLFAQRHLVSVGLR